MVISWLFCSWCYCTRLHSLRYPRHTCCYYVTLLVVTLIAVTVIIILKVPLTGLLLFPVILLHDTRLFFLIPLVTLTIVATHTTLLLATSITLSQPTRLLLQVLPSSSSSQSHSRGYCYACYFGTGHAVTGITVIRVTSTPHNPYGRLRTSPV